MSEDRRHSQSGKVVLVLGSFTHEGVAAAINSMGHRFSRKELYGVSAKTWLKRADHIRELREADKLAGVIVYLATTVLMHAAPSEFAPAWDALVAELSKVKSVVFIFEENVTGDFRIHDYFAEEWVDEDIVRERYEEALGKDDLEHYAHLLSVIQGRRESSLEVHHIVEKLLGSGLDVAPFRTRADVTIRIQEFLEEVDVGIFLRLYVPHGQWQADQLASFLRTFERYLRQVEGKSFSVDARKTNLGTTYYFKSQDGMTSEQMEQAIARFDDFMVLTRDSPNDAIRIFENLGLSPSEASYSVDRYMKEFRRLVLDARHELDHKLLLLRHRFENDIIEGVSKPEISEGNAPSIVLSLSGNSGPISINMGNVTSEQSFITSSQVRSVFDSSITYSQEDERLINLFERFAGRIESVQLKSDLHQMKDVSTPGPSKQTAKQRILAFLARVASKGGEAAVDVGIKVLSTYLEKLTSAG